MKLRSITISATAILLLQGLTSLTWASVVPVDLRCEYLHNPQGIDTPEPRFSWRMDCNDPNARGIGQSAYQVLVSGSQEKLSHDQGDLWDSGKVTGDQSLHIAYAGQLLGSEQGCWWKVRVWDQEGQPSAWSQPARWSMGLLNNKDWKAQWIGHDEPPAKAGENPLAQAGRNGSGTPGSRGRQRPCPAPGTSGGRFSCPPIAPSHEARWCW